MGSTPAARTTCSSVAMPLAKGISPTLMKRLLSVIGIGAGNPDHMTVQAIDALNRADVILIPDKGEEKADLARLRTGICERFIRDRSYRTAVVRIPPRRAVAVPATGADAPSGDAGRLDADYRSAVEDWHEAIAVAYERVLAEEVVDGERAAILVWGDPSLYDSTLRILERVAARGRIELDWDVIPGITSIQALAARHRIVLNEIGGSVTITTGRRLVEGLPAGAATTVVMLDGEEAFRALDPDLEIVWGAYLGMEREILVRGRIGDVAGEIARLRAAAKAQHGWVMDIYMVRPAGKAASGHD
ncbi:precorrin-6A synthase (deacetylating) [Tepidamorphus gemmatus]|uniref:Precorrin-6A synthase (Deacetylating) n=2 Tax=Tepidamorphus gemmatus TaxID=747076 RepID=A0A4R3MGI4_9HYPH|nr:precorrin-6A synthase (deacetylating) [Tepidamorphus gemmatus]